MILLSLTENYKAILFRQNSRICNIYFHDDYNELMHDTRFYLG